MRTLLAVFIMTVFFTNLGFLFAIGYELVIPAHPVEVVSLHFFLVSIAAIMFPLVLE